MFKFFKQESWGKQMSGPPLRLPPQSLVIDISTTGCSKFQSQFYYDMHWLFGSYGVTLGDL